MRAIAKVILLIESARGFDRGLLRGIARYASVRGPWAFFRRPPAYLDPRNPDDTLPHLAAWGADGIICPARLMAQVRRLELPAVVYDVNEHVENVASIVSDDAAAGRLAARHFLDLGLRNFAFCGFDLMRWSRERREAYTAAIAAAGHSVSAFRQSPSPAGRRWHREAPRIAAWLQELPKPLGLFCANDDRAAPIAEICRIHGLRVPDDVAILGVDDDQYVCDLTDPPLSSLAMNTEQAGYTAAETLATIMRRRSIAVSLRITAKATHVVVRQSTNVMAIEDEEVSQALRFIRGNALRPIQVRDVVAHICLSHRSLNERFRRALGHSLIHEITRVRVDRIARFLRETNLPVSKIALMLGYPTHPHLSRYFRRATGKTPLEYRRFCGQHIAAKDDAGS